MRKSTKSEEMEKVVHVDFSHPANQKVLRRITPKKKSSMDFANKDEYDPKLIENVYSKLGMYEEMVRVFWDGITKHLPADCRWILYGRAALVNHRNGVIFGFKAGSYVYALRLPEDIKNEALAKGAKLTHKFSDGTELRTDDLGGDWVFFTRYSPDQLEWCVDAYNYSETFKKA